jgi:hypothetical protein
VPTVLSLIAYDDGAPEGQGDVVALHLRLGLPTNDTAAIALHLATMAQQLARGRPAIGPGDPRDMLGPANLGPPAPATVPVGGRGRGKG